MLNAVRNAAADRKANMKPLGVARFCRRIPKVVGISTKREDRYNRQMPMSKPMSTFIRGVWKKVFHVDACFGASNAVKTGEDAGSVRPNGSLPYRFTTGNGPVC